MATKRRASRRKPRAMSLVRFDFDGLPRSYHRRYPFRRGATYVFLGEIANMGGHCVVADARTGRVYAGYHTENFAEIPRDEV